MHRAPKRQDESARLAELSSLHILDTPPEERFDRITRSAQRMFGAPIALISLIDHNRQWCKSMQGWTAPETPRSVSFCAHVILDDQPFIIEDASADARFSSNPLVCDAPYIRFYAGMSLYGPGGYKVGVLCIIDKVPRQFSDADLMALRDLAAWAESEINTYSLKQASVVARENESKLKVIVDHAADGIIIFNDAGVIETVNIAATAIFGYAMEELSGQSIELLLPEPYNSRARQYLEENRGTGSASKKNFRWEIIGRRKDGSVLPLELTVNAIQLEGRQGFTAVMRDISERRRAESLLHENMALLQAVMDSTSATVFVRDIQGRFLFANRQYARLFFYDENATLVDKHITDVFPPMLAVQSMKRDRAVLESGIPEKEAVTIPSAEGMRTYLLVRSPVRNKKGEIYGVCCVGTDITESKRAEQAMHELNRQLADTTMLQEAILNSANFSIISTDVSGMIRLFNRGAQRMLGYAADQVIGKHSLMILHDSNEVAARANQRAIELEHLPKSDFEVLVAKARGGIADEQEWTYIRRDGERFPVMLSVTPLYDDEHQLSGFLSIAYDVTERKKVEHMKNEFISTVSHELRTPLTSIRGSLGLLAAGKAGDIPASASALLDIAKNNCERLVRLINDILDIEKIESGNIRFDMVKQHILPLVRQAIETMQPYALQHYVVFELHEKAADAYVMVDADRIMQVVVNLLSNAAKFSPAGAKVEINVTQVARSIRVSVRDHGNGIEGEFRSRIFQKFAQADSSDTRKKGGTGLGLSISKAIIEKHGGCIDFCSSSGFGTEFYFDLPTVELPVGQKQGNGRILICEDDADIARLLTMMLSQAGLSSDIAANAAQARQLLATGQYEAMTLDLILPDEDGAVLLRWVWSQEKTRHLPVVIVSAKTENDQRQVIGGAIGIIDWIEKPIDQNRLVSALRNAIKQPSDNMPVVLHIEDDLDVINVVKVLLQPTFSVAYAQTLNEARSWLATHDFDLILLDLHLADGHGSDLLACLPERNACTPVVIFSGQEASQTTSKNVHAALVKSRTSNEQLLAVVQNLIGRALDDMPGEEQCLEPR
jgi:PAS domain S-box-containing protein